MFIQMFDPSGLRGLYGNTFGELKTAKWRGASEQQILDHMGSTELAANLFRATQAEDKLRREHTKGKIRANQLHFQVGTKVRQTIRELGGTMPENLPAAENIEKVARRLKKAPLQKLEADSDIDPSI